MCDPVLIAAILEELGCFDEKKDKERKDEDGAKQPEQGDPKISGEENN